MRHRSALLVGLATATLLGIRPTAAQQPTAQSESTPKSSSNTLAFDVASVKENHSGDGAQLFSITPDGSYRLTNATARMFIRQAYRRQDFQIAGAPSWTDVDRFDVTA